MTLDSLWFANIAVALRAYSVEQRTYRLVRKLEIGHRKRLLVQRVGRTVEAQGRQGALALGRNPVLLQSRRRLRADIEGHAAVGVLLHLAEVVGRECRAVRVGVDEREGSAIVDRGRPELIRASG